MVKVSELYDHGKVVLAFELDLKLDKNSNSDPKLTKYYVYDPKLKIKGLKMV